MPITLERLPSRRAPAARSPWPGAHALPQAGPAVPPPTAAGRRTAWEGSAPRSRRPSGGSAAAPRGGRRAPPPGADQRAGQRGRAHAGGGGGGAPPLFDRAACRSRAFLFVIRAQGAVFPRDCPPPTSCRGVPAPRDRPPPAPAPGRVGRALPTTRRHRGSRAAPRRAAPGRARRRASAPAAARRRAPPRRRRPGRPALHGPALRRAAARGKRPRADRRRRAVAVLRAARPAGRPQGRAAQRCAPAWLHGRMGRRRRQPHPAQRRDPPPTAAAAVPAPPGGRSLSPGLPGRGRARAHAAPTMHRLTPTPPRLLPLLHLPIPRRRLRAARAL
jgi:hypothetical protein